MTDPQDELQRFERGEIDPATFHHGEHVRLAVQFLRAARFADALPRYARGIRAIAAKVGKEEKYNETITTAFLALIAERLRSSPYTSFEAFRADNMHLFDKSALDAFYSPERLHSPDARATFLLPDRAPQASQ